MGLRGLFRLIMLILAVAIVAFAATAYVSWVGMRAENTERELAHKKLANHVQKLEAERAYKKEYYYRLLHDEKFADRVIREKLGFVSKDEVVFRFEDSRPVGIDTPAINANASAGANIAKPQTQDLAAEFKNAEKSPAAQESLLSRMMFWKNSQNPQSPDDGVQTKNKDGALPEIKIDLLEESAARNAGASSPQNAAAGKTAPAGVKFDFSGATGAKTETQSAAAESSATPSEREFLKAQQDIGNLKDADSRATINVKFGASASRTKQKNVENAPKVIRFKSN